MFHSKFTHWVFTGEQWLAFQNMQAVGSELFSPAVHQESDFEPNQID